MPQESRKDAAGDLMADWPFEERQAFLAWREAAWACAGKNVSTEANPMALGAQEALWAAKGALSAGCPLTAGLFSRVASQSAESEQAAAGKNARATASSGKKRAGTGQKSAIEALGKAKQTSYAANMLLLEALERVPAEEWGAQSEGRAPLAFEEILPALRLHSGWPDTATKALQAKRLSRDADALRFAQWLAACEGVECLPRESELWKNKPKTLAWLRQNGAKMSPAGWLQALAQCQKEKDADAKKRLQDATDANGLPEFSVELAWEAFCAQGAAPWKWVKKNFRLSMGDVVQLGQMLVWREALESARKPMNKSGEEERKFARAIDRLEKEIAAQPEAGKESALAALLHNVAQNAQDGANKTTLSLLRVGAPASGVGGMGLPLLNAIERRNFELADALAKNGGWGLAAESVLAQKGAHRQARRAKGQNAIAECAQTVQWQNEAMARQERRALREAISGSKKKGAGTPSKKKKPAAQKTVASLLAKTAKRL